MSGNVGVSRPHKKLCPRNGLFCECPKCNPPICLCALIAACQGEDPEAVRIQFYTAARQA